MMHKPEIIDFAEKCGWTSLMTFQKKENIVATLLLHEIIWKRQTAINQLADGLKSLEVIDMLRKHPESFREKFVASNVTITKDRLLEEMVIASPNTEEEERAKSFFLQYIGTEEQISIGDGNRRTRQEALMMFSTGQEILGKAALREKILVEYTSVDNDEFLAAGTCSNNLVIPTKHDTIEAFTKAMDKAFELEMTGFGEA
eukprot:Seg1598.20 transcript_id=Seg1598.20/GoldUCD/mRNA.D3Y31 product="G2/M phase-specific E3 ubiquitin-protein ligase" protein_id=Seg1598.20/GoldUCD/D3Y31